MKKGYAVIPALFLLFFATALPAAAPGPGDGKPTGLTRPGSAVDQPDRFDGGVKLSREQKEKARDLESRHYADTRDLRYELEQKKLELRKLFTDPGAAEAALLVKEKEIGTLQQKMFEKRVQMKIEWRRILTADQIRELDRMPMGPEPGPRPAPHMGPNMGPAAMSFGIRGWK